MSLGLNIAQLAGPGRPSKPLEINFERELNEADIAQLQTGVVGMVPAPLKRITDRHHSLARLLAAGTPEGEAALIVGYDNARVSILKNSPAFAELLALYRAEVKQEFATVLDHMAGLSRDALVELRDRLEDNPDKFTNNELLKMVTETVDRTAQEDSGEKAMPTLIELVVPDGADQSED